MLLGDPDYDLKRGAGVESQDEGSQEGPRSNDLRVGKWSPLPGTRKEAEAVVKALDGARVRLRLGADAREDSVKAANAPRVLHLATHGFFLEDQEWQDEGASHAARGFSAPETSLIPRPLPVGIENPLLRSGLVFAGANQMSRALPEGEDDGIFTALEATGLNLQGTDLVVLSACETGVGETRRGEGVFGLRRAFQLAGARTVVMSLWSVPDEETATLMGDFYERMASGEGKSRALQDAMLAQMRSRREEHGAAHPFYWGAFVSVGEP